MGLYFLTEQPEGSSERYHPVTHWIAFDLF
jgi:hypothetical protein